ncbi:hypothetical protein P4679_24535 [Priestia megaterium]|uniref:hypothetical protein n=1 Tax=Priestia megaterium TaxID=1404 RepID=UPI002E200041|nr:hypothetical protein [Priestia megaterium]
MHINDKHRLPLIFADVDSKIDIPYGRTDFGRFESFLEDNVKVNPVNTYNAEPVN